MKQSLLAFYHLFSRKKMKINKITQVVKKTLYINLSIYCIKNDYYYILNGEYKGLFNLKSFYDLFVFKERKYPQIDNINLTLETLYCIESIFLKIPNKIKKLNEISFIFHNGKLNKKNILLNINDECIDYSDLSYSRNRKYTKNDSICLKKDCSEPAILSHIYSSNNEIGSFKDSFFKVDLENIDYLKKHKKFKIKEIKKQKNVKRCSEPTKRLYCKEHDNSLFKHLDDCNNNVIDISYAKEISLRSLSTCYFEFNEVFNKTKYTLEILNNYNFNTSISELFLCLVRKSEVKRLTQKKNNLLTSKNELKNKINDLIDNKENYIYKIFQMNRKTMSFVSYSKFDDDYSIISSSRTNNKNNFIIISIPDNKNKDIILNRYSNFDFVFNCLKSQDLISNRTFIDEYFSYNENLSIENYDNEIHNINLENKKTRGFSEWIDYFNINCDIYFLNNI